MTLYLNPWTESPDPTHHEPELQLDLQLCHLSDGGIQREENGHGHANDKGDADALYTAEDLVEDFVPRCAMYNFQAVVCQRICSLGQHTLASSPKLGPFFKFKKQLIDVRLVSAVGDAKDHERKDKRPPSLTGKQCRASALTK